MKKIIILLAVFTLLVAGTAFATVKGSKHDLSSTLAGTYAGTSNQVCIYCHTPHMAQVTATAGAPLWNKDLGVRTVSGSYTSPTFDNSKTVAVARATTITPLCMSCHDGQTAAAQHYEGTGKVDTGKQKLGAETVPYTTVVRLFTGTGDIDLAKNHPVDFQFLPGNDLKIISTSIGVGKTYPLFGVDGNFTCVTCHDVHASGNVNNQMLRGTASLNQSAFCLECHDK